MFAKGKREGKGTLTLQDKTIHGTWSNDELNLDNMTINYVDGREYQGPVNLDLTEMSK